MISAPGIGSGLDVGSIVDQLMDIERLPLNQLENDKQTVETQLSTLGQLKSSMSAFQDSLSSLKTLNAFEVYQADSSDEQAFTATTNSNAAIGFTTIEVIALAEAHKMGSVAIADTDTTLLGNAGEQLGFTVNGNSFSVSAGGMTLSDLRDAINDAPDNTGVSATLISESATSHRLVLTATETGNENAINLVADGALATALGMTDINNPAQLDAELQVDGLYTITRPGNNIDDAITGVTLELHAVSASPGQLSITRDTEAVTGAVQGFVDAFNELRGTMKEMAGNDSALDSTLRSIESQMRSVFNTPPDAIASSFNYLTEAGVSFLRDGSLSVDNSAIEAAVGQDFAGFAELFANDPEGYLFRLDAVTERFVQFDGLLDTRKNSLDDRARSLDDRIADMEFRLEIRERALLDQFNALDTLMGQLQGTSAFLTQQLSALPAPGTSV